MNLRAIAVVLVAAGAAMASPADAVAAATADLARYRPIEGRVHQRYLWVPPGVDVKAWAKCLDFWTNSLSRNADLTPLWRVRHDLLRLDLRDYGMDPYVWGRLAHVDPYFHVKIKQGGKTITAHAPWLDARLIASLAEMADSSVPIVRGDWWLVQTAQQVDRQGTGYYDFIGVKNRRDFQGLVGLDEKLAVRFQREVRAIVARSGVALNNRQIVRFGTIGGGYWATLDSFKSTNGNNAVRQLNGDYQHDAEEVYGALPNGLFAFGLFDANGTRQDSVPDAIASDGVAPGNDRRIHPGISCVRCHVEGIRPIADWARRVYRPPVGLGAIDYERLQRLKRIYLGDLERWIKRDQADYAEALYGLTALKPAEMARLMGRLHAQYQEADISLAQLAREAGYSEAHGRAALLAALKGTPPLDPVLAGFLAETPEMIRREHAEEVFSLFMTHLKGYIPRR